MYILRKCWSPYNVYILGHHDCHIKHWCTVWYWPCCWIDPWVGKAIVLDKVLGMVLGWVGCLVCLVCVVLYLNKVNVGSQLDIFHVHGHICSVLVRLGGFVSLLLALGFFSLSCCVVVQARACLGGGCLSPSLPCC